MVSDELDALQARFPACETLAYADLTTGMILVTNSNTPLERNALNRLCAEAAAVLGGSGASPMGSMAAETALVSGQDGVRFFVRAPDLPNDALLCVGQAGLDIAAFAPEAKACLKRIGEDG